MTGHDFLGAFCGEPDARYFMQLPYVQCGWRYATDGRIVVRVPSPGEPDTPEPAEGRLPPDLLYDFPAQIEEMIPWPAPEYTIGECDACRGTGKELCRVCDSETRHECSACAGAGKVPIGLNVGYWFIAARYDRLIRDLPGVMFCNEGTSSGPLYFRFDGGEGLVMPLRR